MKKFFVLVAVIMVCAACLAACSLTQTSAHGVAEAAGTELYIYIRPDAATLAANESAVPSSVLAQNDSGSEFYLTSSYCYRVHTVAGSYLLDDFNSGYYYIENLPEGVTASATLPEGFESSEVPSAPLALAEGATVTLVNATTVTAEDGYTFAFVGYANQERTRVTFAATHEGDTLFGTAEAEAFMPFTVGWQALAAAEREELVNPETSSDDNLTGGEPSDALRIILIIGIAVPALIIVLLLFKPTSKKRGYDKRAMRHDPAQNIDYDRERNYNADRDRYDRGYRDYERRSYPERRDYDRRDYDYDRGRGYGSDRDYGRDYDVDRRY